MAINIGLIQERLRASPPMWVSSTSTIPARRVEPLRNPSITLAARWVSLRILRAPNLHVRAIIVRFYHGGYPIEYGYSGFRRFKMAKVVTVPMHEGATFSWKMPEWVKLAIADSLIVFGRMEQRIIEIAWLLKDADIKERVKTARAPAVENFEGILDVMEEFEGKTFDGLRKTFEDLSKDRNLIAHGSWLMIDGARPWVVWHKFIEDESSVIGEFYEKGRFADFKKKADYLYEMCGKYHDMLEKTLGKTTSALRRVSADK
jgi:hypothetical protein